MTTIETALTQWKNKIRKDPLLSLFNIEKEGADLVELDRRDIMTELEMLKTCLREKISRMKES